MEKEKSSRIIIYFFAAFLMLLGLLWINRDLFRYEYAFLGGRTFVPGTDGKGEYLLTEEIPLKSAAYQLIFEGTVSGRGSAVFLTDAEEKHEPVTELQDGTEPLVIPFSVSGGTRPVRIGISYDGKYSAIEVKKIRIVSDHVLYKGSLIRHVVTSAVWLLLCALVLWRLLDKASFRSVIRFLPDGSSEMMLGLLLLLTGFTCYPFFKPGTYIHAEDLFFHLSRIEGLAESLKAGYFPVRDQLFWLKNYGYGTGYFYPDVFLYFPALLRLCGFSLLSIYRIFILLTTFAGVCSIYLCTKRITASRTGALTAAVLFAFSTYRLIAVYYRAGFGEIQSMIFIPLIVMGLYEMSQGKYNSWIWFSLGFLGILYSHVISLVLVFAVTAVVLLLLLPKRIRDKAFLFGLVKAVALAVLLDAFFLLPMLEQTRLGGLNINVLLSDADSGISLRNLDPWRNLFLFFHSWDYGEGFSRRIYPGWSFLLLPLLCWIGSRKKVRAADLLLGVGLVLMFLGTDLFPWERFTWFLLRIQFSWRLLMPVSVIFPMAAGMYAASFTAGGRRIRLSLLFAAAVGCAVPILVHSWNVRAADSNLFIMQDNRVCGREYMPFALDPEYIDKNANTVRIDGNAVVTAFKRKGLNFRFTWSEGSGPQRFSVPLIFYAGVRASELRPDGTRIPIPSAPDDWGLVYVESSEAEGTILVEYQKTPLMRIGEGITLLTLIVTGIYLRKRAVFSVRKEVDHG